MPTHMTARYDSVLGKNNLPNQADFLAQMTIGLSRAAAKVGRGSLADTLDLSGPGLDNLFTGTMPKAKRLFDMLAADFSALDEIADLYGARVVPKGSICDTDQKAAPALVAALHKVIEAEADGTIDHIELLGMEREVIAAEQAIQLIRSRITELRTPRAVQQ